LTKSFLYANIKFANERRVKMNINSNDLSNKNEYQLRCWPFGLDLKTVAHIMENGERRHVLSIESKTIIEIGDKLRNSIIFISFFDPIDEPGIKGAKILSGKFHGHTLFLELKEKA